MKIIKILISFTVISVLIGCGATAISDKHEPRWQTTASYETIMTTQSTPNPGKPRNWDPSRVNYTNCVVTHFGSYYDDEFAVRGDGNNTYGWSWMDVAAIGYCPARFVINTVCVPISMVKEPPCVLVTTNLDQKYQKDQGPETKDEGRRD